MLNRSLIIFGFCGSLAACSAILGIDDLPSATEEVGDATSPETDSATGDALIDSKNNESDSEIGVVDAGEDVACIPPYCEDFESYPSTGLTNSTTLGPWAVSVTTGVTAKVERVGVDGGMGLYVNVPSSISQGATLTYNLDGGGIYPSKKLFGRALVLFDNPSHNGPLPSQHIVYYQSTAAFVDGGGATATEGIVAGEYAMTEETAGVTGEPSANGPAVVADAWHCVQWEYDGTVGVPGTNEVTVWIDGARQIFSTDGWSTAEPWTSFKIGLTDFVATTTGITMFLDDFALSDKMIPCP